MVTIILSSIRQVSYNKGDQGVKAHKASKGRWSKSLKENHCQVFKQSEFSIIHFKGFNEELEKENVSQNEEISKQREENISFNQFLEAYV